ncbi:MAG: FAD-dependent oxidoreductase [Verrucomicrobia bacterium]|nr:FAD-dependent oxidoreductase [Verrucomicrobiota bacterium]
MAESKHLVVCGGGILGLYCAHYLARDGHRVTLIERHGPEHTTCAEGSAGYISPSHVVPLAAPGMVWMGLKWMFNPRSPFYLKPRLDLDFIRWGVRFARSCNAAHVARSAPVLRDLCLASRELFVEFSAEDAGGFELERAGLLMLCQTEEALGHEAELVRLANELGVEAKVLDPRQTAEVDGSGVQMRVAGSVFFPIDAHLTPTLLMPRLRARVAEAGVDVKWNTELRGWRTFGGRVAAVQTSAGEIAADGFVLAGGSWSGELVKSLGLTLPMQAGKGYSLMLPAPRRSPRIPAIFVEKRIAVTPMGRTLRFGGTMELSGINDTIRPERVRQIVESVPEYYPEFGPDDFAGVQPWFGLRPVSPDGMPYIGPFAKFPNLYAACGHAMLGVTLAPITGRLVAELVGGRRPSVALDLLHPDRFA